MYESEIVSCVVNDTQNDIMSRVSQVNTISEQHWKIFDQALSAGDLSAFVINNTSVELVLRRVNV